MNKSTTETQGRLRGIYLLPNSLTTAGLFAAFYAIVAGMKGLFEHAAIAIFIAMLIDSMDGRVARLTNTDSHFGAHYDSLSDMVAFGVAPALIAYSWSLHFLGKIGWLIAFFYTASTALRLARFNTEQGENVDKRYFQGLPSPSAAAILASMVWLGHTNQVQGTTAAITLGITAVIVGILMVSNVRFHSFKELEFKGSVPFFTIFFVVLVFVAISINPPVALFAIFTLYALLGPLITLWQRHKIKRPQKKNKS